MVLAIPNILCILLIMYPLTLANSNNIELGTQTAMETENWPNAMTMIINQLTVIVGDCGGIIASLINQIIIIMKKKK